MANSVPVIKFYNETGIPQLGLGTWKSKPEEVFDAVRFAIDCGYRHFDCAHVYQNEAEVGKAIANKIAEGCVTRDELFITSKLWNTFHNPELVEKAAKTTLSNLRLEYLDLYLIHWPTGWKEGETLHPVDEQGKVIFSDIDYIDTWKGMEHLVDKGFVRSIGLSNFNQNQINRVLNNCKIRPTNNQIECHPYLNQNKLVEYCQNEGITITAYSPLGSPDRPWAKPDDKILMADPLVTELATKYGKSAAQMLIRYQIQRGLIVIPKSVNQWRIQQNFKVFDFEISVKDMEKLNKLDCNVRVCPLDSSLGHPFHPFEKDEF